MVVIGLVGGSGSGKGEVGRIFSRYGYLIYDTDAVYHDMTAVRSECTEAIASAFGPGVLSPDGALNRRALAEIVFAPGETAERQRQQLNQIAHEYVRRAFSAFTSSHQDARIVLDAPLLFEAAMDRLCDMTIAVTAPHEERIKRIMQRDHISREDAMRRIDSQISEDRLVELCDLHICNDGTICDLTDVTEKMIQIINERIENHE